MHVPAFLKIKHWQFFILGFLSGTVISYLLLLFLFGNMYHNLHIDLASQTTERNELKRQIKSLQKDKASLENEPLKIESITFKLLANKQTKLTRLQELELEELLQKEVHLLIGKNLDAFIDHYDTFIALLERKTFTVDDQQYKVKTSQLIVHETVEWTVSISKTT